VDRKSCSLGVVLYPNLQETKEAAAQGNDEAIKALRHSRGGSSTIVHCWTGSKRKNSAAPINCRTWGDSLEFEWDFQKGNDGEWYQVIRAGDVELWRELAFFNSPRRFEEIKGLL
jgi:hypothetical protein